jgi:hypothetical protein
MRVSRSLSILLTLAFALACDFEHSCRGENLLTIATPATVESFEVKDARGETLWKLAAVAPQKLSTIRYGEVPRSYVQSFPTPGVRPRDFVVNEQLSTVTITPERTFVHDGNAIGPIAFCGGWYESSPRKQ